TGAALPDDEALPRHGNVPACLRRPLHTDVPGASPRPERARGGGGGIGLVALSHRRVRRGRPRLHPVEALGDGAGPEHRPRALAARDPLRRAPVVLGAERSPWPSRSERTIGVAEIEVSHGAVDASPAPPPATPGVGPCRPKVRLAPELAPMAAVVSP